MYRKTYINRTLVGDKIVDNSDNSDGPLALLQLHLGFGASYIRGLKVSIYISLLRHMRTFDLLTTLLNTSQYSHNSEDSKYLVPGSSMPCTTIYFIHVCLIWYMFLIKNGSSELNMQHSMNKENYPYCIIRTCYTSIFSLCWTILDTISQGHDNIVVSDGSNMWVAYGNDINPYSTNAEYSNHP